MLLSYVNKPDITAFIQKYSDVHPLLSKMGDTKQDALWHQEGDVRTHVSMVLSELYKLLDNEFSYLEDRDKEILTFAAAYHDYAKPITTRTDEGIGDRVCVISPRHEQVGASLLLLSARPEELSKSEWLSVVKLVANHQMPKRAISNSYSRGSMLRLLLDSKSLLLLYVLSLADFKGRIAPDMDRHIEDLELFLIESEIQGFLWNDDQVMAQFRAKMRNSGLIGVGRYKGDECFDDSTILEQTVTALTKDRISHPVEGFSLPFNHKRESYVFVLCGLSASGKSTLAIEYADKHCAEIISLDLIREEVGTGRGDQSNDGKVRRLAMERLRECLRNKRNVVWDATSLREDFRTAVTSLARGYRAYTKVVCLTTTWEECVKRDAKRKHAVGEKVIREQFEKFQIPSAKEADSVVFV